MTKDDALEVPLIELLKAVPKTARLIIDSSDGISSTFYPVGHLCHKAAEALAEQPTQEPLYFGLTLEHTWLSVSEEIYNTMADENRMEVRRVR
jgi:hypothetical protein